MRSPHRPDEAATHLARTVGVALVAVATLSSCGGDAASSSARRTAGSGPSAPSSAAPPVRTASYAENACGWISEVEVAAVVGPLAGPARTHEGGCLYPLPLDAETARRRELARDTRRKLEEQFGPSDWKDPPDQEPAVIVHVDLSGDLSGERAVGAANQVMAGWIGDSGVSDPSPSSAPPGWDHLGTILGYPGIFARVGHLTVSVSAQGIPVSHETKVALAVRVRDRVPDLPFASDPRAPAQAEGGPSGRDPCSLLTAREAEAVLGELIVPPYRARSETPLADPRGASCAYFTAGHRALVLEPTWEYGGIVVDAIRLGSGLVGAALPQLQNAGADTLEGPWEEVGGDPGTGALYFLKGERVLVIHYLMSSTDVAGATRLARIAVERL